MRRALPAILMALPVLSAPAQELEVRMDPRLEMLAIPFWLAGHPAFGKTNLEEYRANLEAHFRAHQAHDAVRLARELGPKATWESLVHLAQRLQDASTFEPAPGQTVDPAWAPYLQAMAAFARETRASAFLADNQSMYKYLVVTCRVDLGQRLSPASLQRALGEAPALPPAVWVSPLLGGGEHATCLVLPTEGVTVVGTDRTATGSMPSYRDSFRILLTQTLQPPVATWAANHAAELRPAASALQRPVQLMQQVVGAGSAEAVLGRSLLGALIIRTQQDQGGLVTWTTWDTDERDGIYWTWDLAKAMKGIDGPILGPELIQRLDRFAKEAPALAAAWRKQRQPRIDLALQGGPRLVATSPANGAAGIDPALTLLTFTFDRPMDTARIILPGKGAYPVFVGEASWDSEGKVLAMPVRLAPRTTYAFSLNSMDLLYFKDRKGRGLAPVEVQFKTR